MVVAAHPLQPIALRDGLFFLARLGQSVLGTVMVGYDGHRGWIDSLAVQPDQPRNGLGSGLLRFAEARLSELGCMKVNLQILEGNQAVVSFYERHGYETEPRVSVGKRLMSG